MKDVAEVSNFALSLQGNKDFLNFSFFVLGRRLLIHM